MMRSATLLTVFLMFLGQALFAQDKSADTKSGDTKSGDDKAAVTKTDDKKSDSGDTAKTDGEISTEPEASEGSAGKLVWGEGSYEQQAGDYWFPRQASDFAADVDWLFYFIFWVCVFFFAIIIGVMVGFVIKYRKRPGHEKPLPSPSHNTTLEILWSVLPSFLLVFMFVAGTSGYFKQRVAPVDSYTIFVEGKQFDWTFETEEGDITTDLHLVQGEAFLLKMESRDVLHSLYIPAFRQKMDVVPGRDSQMWVRPTQPGRYRLYCAEYCGDGHSLMTRVVQVHKTWEEFRKHVFWDEEKHPAWENGQRLYNIQCSGCHTNDGGAKTGPSFKGIWGKEETLMDGSTITVDDQYVRDSIDFPQKHVVKGYGPKSQMASFKGKLSPNDYKYIIEYLKTLKE